MMWRVKSSLASMEQMRSQGEDKLFVHLMGSKKKITAAVKSNVKNHKRL